MKQKITKATKEEMEEMESRFQKKFYQCLLSSESTGVIVYDTQMGAPDNADPITPVGAGSSIVIQK